MGLKTGQQQQQQQQLMMRHSKDTVEMMVDAIAVIETGNPTHTTKAPAPPKRRVSMASVTKGINRLADKLRRRSKFSSELLVGKAGTKGDKKAAATPALRADNAAVLHLTKAHQQLAAANAHPTAPDATLELKPGSPEKERLGLEEATTEEAEPAAEPEPAEVPIAYMCASALEVFKTQPFTLLEKMTRYAFDLSIGEPPEDTPSEEARIQAAAAVRAERGTQRPRLPTYDQHEKLINGATTTIIPL